METQTPPVLHPETAMYPTLADRIQSAFIDAMFIVMVMLAAASLLEQFQGAPDWIRIALFFGLWAVYEPLCTAMGGTIGNHLKGIRVRKHQNTAKKINFLQAFCRYIIKLFLGWISFISIHTNKERRAIHDLVAGSVMVKK